MRVTRSDTHLPAVARGATIHVQVDGRSVIAHQGETIAAVLMAEGIRVFRHSPGGMSRGIFCGMGICYECLVTADGMPNVRACMTPVAPGMVIETGARSDG